MRFKLVLKALFIAMVSTSVSASTDSTAMLAFYEISAEVNGSSSQIRTSKPIEFGKPITHEFGEYQLSMLFEPAESDEFTLAASLNAIVPSTNAIVYTMLSESFVGKISTPRSFGQSEFTIEEGEISISIVLRLPVIE
jgi:hypothetical protein